MRTDQQREMYNDSLHKGPKQSLGQIICSAMPL